MKCKIPFWLKVGLIVAAVVLFVEVLNANFIFTIYAFPQLLEGVFYLISILHYPFVWVGSMNDSFVLYLTDHYDTAFYSLSIFGIVVVTLFWGLAGAGLGRLYEVYFKK